MMSGSFSVPGLHLLQLRTDEFNFIVYLKRRTPVFLTSIWIFVYFSQASYSQLYIYSNVIQDWSQRAVHWDMHYTIHWTWAAKLGYNHRPLAQRKKLRGFSLDQSMTHNAMGYSGSLRRPWRPKTRRVIPLKKVRNSALCEFLNHTDSISGSKVWNKRTITFFFFATSSCLGISGSRVYFQCIRILSFSLWLRG